MVVPIIGTYPTKTQTYRTRIGEWPMAASAFVFRNIYIAAYLFVADWVSE